MKQLTHSRHFQSIADKYSDSQPMHVDQEILQRVTGLIFFGTNLINMLIIIRFLLDLINASFFNPFARLILHTTEPFLSVFRGLTYAPPFSYITLELTTLIAITVYSLLGWSIARLLQIMLTRQY